jgi:hypothetical protein
MTRTLADGRRDTKLGTTPSGKVIWLEKHPSEYKGWSPSDHLYAAVIHGANHTRGGAIETAHRALAGKGTRSHSTTKSLDGFKIGDAVQLRWEPGTGGVIRRLAMDDAEGRNCAWIATPRGERKVPTDAIRIVRKEHEDRVRRASDRHHSTMKKSEPITDVVFRVFPDGDVIALFPKDKYGPRTINSYQHVGQHGEASPALIKELRAASPTEYAPLLAELKSIGYRLRVDKSKSAGGVGARTKDLEWRDSPRRGAGVLTAQGRGGRGSGYYEIELHQGHTVRYHSPDGSQVLTGPHAGGLKFAKEIANDHNRSPKRGK